MTALANLFMWACVISLALLADKPWVRYVRPALASRFGWGALPADSEIPAAWCFGVPGVLLVVGVLLKIIAPAAGY